MEWQTNVGSLIESDQFELAFRLRSRPLFDVDLELRCEGTEIVAQLSHNRQADNEATNTQNSSRTNLGRVTVTPDKWDTQQSFLLRLKSTVGAPGSYLAQNGVFQVTSLNGFRSLRSALCPP